MPSILEGVEDSGLGGGAGAVPATPSYVQALQQIVMDEIDTANTTKTNMTGGNAVTLLFDKDMTTGYSTTGPVPAPSIAIKFKFPIMIARVSPRVTVGALAAGVTVFKIDGTSSVQALDTNFTPIMAIGITITPIDVATITEIVVMKVIEVKGTFTATVIVDDTPATPIFVQDQGQVCAEEVTLTGSAGVANLSNLLDKSYLTGVTVGAGAQAVTVTFNSPILIDRIALIGVLSYISITATRIDGVNIPIVAANTATVQSYDAMNFAPFYCSVITISQGVGSAGSLLTELMVQKVLEVKAFAQDQIAQLTEFYGQKVSYDPFVNNLSGQTTTVNYLLLRRALEVDADNDPAVNNDSTVVAVTSDVNDIERINTKFYVPSDDIRVIRGQVTMLATVEVGTNMRCTAIKYRIYKNAIATGTLTALTTQKTISSTFDGATSRAVRAIIQDLTYNMLEKGSDLVLEISVWGRQVASSATPAYITLWHRRGLGDVKVDGEVITQSAQVMV